MDDKLTSTWEVVAWEWGGGKGFLAIRIDTSLLMSCRVLMTNNNNNSGG